MSEERLKAVESDVVELKSSVNQMCDSVRGLTSEIREMVLQNARTDERWHQQSEINRSALERISRHDSDIKELQINQAVNKSKLDPLIGMFWRVAGTIAGAAVLGGIAYKLYGG